MAKGKICRVKECNKVLNVTAGQICQMHRSRWFRNKSYEIPETSNRKKYYKPALTKLGYIRINVDGRRILEHRYVMEKYIGRKLKPRERVHHINHDRTDNRIENLQLFKNNSEHIKQAHPIRWHERKNRYSTEILENIFAELSKPPDPSKPCFCGKSYAARNLCSKHYQWVWKHKFI